MCVVSWRIVLHARGPLSRTANSWHCFPRACQMGPWGISVPRVVGFLRSVSALLSPPSSAGWGWSSSISWQVEMKPYVWGRADPEHAWAVDTAVFRRGAFFHGDFRSPAGWLLNNNRGENSTIDDLWMLRRLSSMFSCEFVARLVFGDVDYWF